MQISEFQRRIEAIYYERDSRGASLGRTCGSARRWGS
jgi:hypothetical protein